jgi:hypothetical protein
MTTGSPQRRQAAETQSLKTDSLSSLVSQRLGVSVSPR